MQQSEFGRGVRQQLLREGFVVLERFFKEQELQTLQLEAEVVLETAGAYEVSDADSAAEGVARNRGCVFEVVRPYGNNQNDNNYGNAGSSIRGRAASGPPRMEVTCPANGDGGCSGSSGGAGGRSALAAPVRLPGPGLLASPRLHCLVRSALGFSGSCCCCCCSDGDDDDNRDESGDGNGGGVGTADDGGGPWDGRRRRQADVGVAQPSGAGSPGGAACGRGDSRSGGGGGGGDSRRNGVGPANGAAAGAAVQAAGQAGAEAVAGPTAATPAEPDGGGGGGRTVNGGPYLFNEQFIAKPPRSSGRAAFGWHRDSDWCRGRAEYEYGPYISVWTAVDDMTAANGALAVVPRSHLGLHAPPPAPGGAHGDAEATPAATPRGKGAGHGDSGEAGGAAEGPRRALKRPRTEVQEEEGDEQEEEEEGGRQHEQQQSLPRPAEHLFVPAGTVVVFLDTLTHASGPNRSRHTRRAWMPQFSAQPILHRTTADKDTSAAGPAAATAASDDGKGGSRPVALAVPLAALLRRPNGAAAAGAAAQGTVTVAGEGRAEPPV